MVSTAVMFPGLGAEYPGMVARFCAHYPESAAVVRSWSEACAADLCADPPEEAREHQRHRQLQVHALNLLWWRQQVNQCRDAAVCGHSLGFYAALVAAGVIDEAFSLQLVDTVFALSWDAWAENGHEVAAITAHRPLDPRDILDRYGLETLCVNSDAQLVVYGPPPAVTKLCDDVGDDLIRLDWLASSIPFHSWTMRGVTAALRRLMTRDAWPLCEPERMLWCHVGARPLGTAAAAAEVLVTQPRLPVLWRDAIRAMRLHGVSEFRETGPNRILTQMVRSIAPGAKTSWSDHLRPRRGAA